MHEPANMPRDFMCHDSARKPEGWLAVGLYRGVRGLRTCVDCVPVPEHLIITVSKLESGVSSSESGIDIRRTEILQLFPMSISLMSIPVELAIAAEAVEVAVDMVIPCISMIDC